PIPMSGLVMRLKSTATRGPSRMAVGGWQLAVGGSVQIRSTNDETLEQNARTPHPAFGHPLPASRGEGHSTLTPRVSFSPLAGRRCREAADEGLALGEFGQHWAVVGSFLSANCQPPTANS